MTYWDLSFDVAAIFFLLLILIWYISERRIPIKSHRMFLIYLITTFAATSLEIIATLMARNMDKVGYTAFYNVLTLQTLAINMIPISFSYYLLMLAHVDVKKKKPLRLFYFGAILADVIILSLNPLFRWAFTFENEKYAVYHIGWVMYAIDAVMIGICVVTIIRFKQNFQFLRFVPLVFNLTCGVVACVAQIFFYYPVLNLMLVGVSMTLFHYQQNSGTVTDVVTGLFNRRFFGEYIHNKFLEHKRFGVIVVAMDDFKFVNKTYGVETGDRLLYQIGHFLEQIPGNRTVFRFGSDQFCVVVDKHVGNVMNMAEHILERFRHPWFNDTQTAIMLSGSICCMECPRDAQSYGELVEVMDYSMSIAKKTRKGQITNIGEIELDKIKRDKAIEKAVKISLDRDEFMVYYQPIFSVTEGIYSSAEALVRLHDEELGWISPEDFIPIAEKNGLIVEMGERILKKVCRFIRDFELAKTSVKYIEVNISPIQLIQQNFAERVKHILEEYEVSPSQINIEITETATVNGSTIISDNINALVDYGITFSLDDYGSGNANIDYINHMPFKIIKIDKYIIWDSFKNSKACVTLEYTIGMLKALELYIVAEGVETEEMKTQLEEIGCHYLQGWYYSKAVPPEEFIGILQAQR